MRIETEGLGLDGVSLASGRTMALAQPTASSPSSAHPPAFSSPIGNGRTRMETNAPLHEPQPQAYYNDPPVSQFNPSHSHANSHNHSHHWHAHHPAANLHITVPPPPRTASPVGFSVSAASSAAVGMNGNGNVSAKGTLSPHDSYPSPPPSLDSPPLTAKGLQSVSSDLVHSSL